MPPVSLSGSITLAVLTAPREQEVLEGLATPIHTAYTAPRAPAQVNSPSYASDPRMSSDAKRSAEPLFDGEKKESFGLLSNERIAE